MSAANFTPRTTLAVGASWSLVEGPYIAMSVSAAVALGHQEAIFLQHLHFWLDYKARNQQKHFVHGVPDRSWVYWTYDELVQQIPLGKSVSPHKRVVKHLRRLGILLVEQQRSNAWDQTCHYSIDYEMLAEVLECSQLEDDSNGNKMLFRASEKHLLRPCDSSESIRIESSDHSTESSSQNSSKRTTTKEAVDPLNALDGIGGCGAHLDVHEIPSAIQSQVFTLLAQMPDGQRYVDLLAARLRRAAESPGRVDVVHPILWLKSIIASSAPDFSEADRIAEQRHAAKIHRALAEEQRLSEQASAAANDAAREQRYSAAAKLLASLDEDGRKALADATRAAVVPPKTRACISDAVLRGVLPDQPFALSLVLKAIERMSASAPDPDQGEEP